MPKQNNLQKTYTSLDMLGIHTLAENDMAWMATALSRVLLDFTQLSKDLQKTGVHSVYFDELRTFLNMYSYLADERHSYYVEAVEEHKKACAMASQKEGANHA